MERVDARDRGLVRCVSVRSVPAGWTIICSADRHLFSAYYLLLKECMCFILCVRAFVFGIVPCYISDACIDCDF